MIISLVAILITKKKINLTKDNIMIYLSILGLSVTGFILISKLRKKQLSK